MDVNKISGVNLNSYVPNVKPIEHLEKVQEVQKQASKKLEAESLSDKAAGYLDTLKKKFNNFDFKVVKKEDMEKIKDNPAKYSENKTTVFIDEEELEKMAKDPEFAKKQEENLTKTAKKLPELKNELDKMGANVISMGFVIENDKVSLFTQLQKPEKKEDEITKLAERNKENVEKRQQERIREIRKKYEPVKRPSDDTTIIKRDDTITIITDSFMDLSAAIGDFGRDYYFKQEPSGLNVDVSL